MLQQVVRCPHLADGRDIDEREIVCVWKVGLVGCLVVDVYDMAEGAVVQQSVADHRHQLSQLAPGCQSLL